MGIVRTQTLQLDLIGLEIINKRGKRNIRNNKKNRKKLFIVYVGVW
jgi:hypothetical protein